MKHIRRVVVGVVGGTVLIIGIALIVLPGPAFLVIPLGLAILSAEFAWARRWLKSAKAILPRKRKEPSPGGRRITLQSIRRSAGFLYRQVRRTFQKRQA